MKSEILKLASEFIGKVFPGGVVGVFDSRGLREVVSFGEKEIGGEKVSEDTIYDLASLTKVIVTAPLFMKFVESGRISLRTRLKYVFKELEDDWKGNLTFFDLLTHTSGLPSYVRLEDFKDPIEALFSMKREYETGKRVVYSCMGYILTGMALERISGKNLDILAKEMIFDPLGMKSTFYNPPKDLNIAPTTRRGVVHDPNSHTLKGVSGNAGLFSNVFDIVNFMISYINGEILSIPALEYSIRDHTPALNEHRGIGWKIAKDSVVFPELISESSFGHTGYTGTQVWYDPERDCGLVILTNRVNLSDSDESKILNNEFRRRIGNLVVSRC